MRYRVTGDLELTPDGIVEGWVWSCDRPDDGLVAEILVDDVCVGAVAATAFRRDLIARGMGDGQHGYRLRLPPGTIPADGPVVISARDQASRQVFARIVRQGAALATRHREALDDAGEQMRGLWAGLETVLAGRTGMSKAEQLRDTFGQLAALLAARAGARDDTAPLAPAIVLDRLRRRAGRLDLPLIGAPALSLVMPAGRDAAATLRRLAALAPALRPAEAEIVLVDDGADPAAALLPALAPNLVYLRAASPERSAEALAEAAGGARGTAVAVLEAEPPAPSATALLALARRTAAAPRTVLLGAAALAACNRVAALDASPPECPAPGRLGLRIALSGELLVRAGGLEPAMMDGAALESADLWLRCRLLGADALVWREPAGRPGDAPARRVAPQTAQRALEAFRQRWPAAGRRPEPHQGRAP
jgi:hypothetical protein